MPGIPQKKQAKPSQPVDKIDPSLHGLVVPIDKPIFDPNNARLHPEQNIEDIKASLARYGQRSPIVVDRATGHVMKGNGTLRAARELGWTQIAAAEQDFADEVEAVGYGVADNRTGESSKWDFEVLARLDRIVQEGGGQDLVGWSPDELTVLRANVDLPTPAQAGGQTWQELWQGMPEFVQDDQTSAARVVVHFRSEEDFDAFLSLIGQERGDVRQHSLWHPKAELGRFADKRYAAKEGT